MTWLLLLVTVAPTVVPTPAMSLADVRATWRDGRLVAIDEPGGFREGLLETGLLAELNRNRWTPRAPDGSFDPDAVHRLWVADRFAVAFDARHRLRFALFRYSVPVDPKKDASRGWSPERLHRRQRLVEELSASLRLRPSGRDRYGNVFEWRGRKGATTVSLRYEPKTDALFLLLRY